MTFFGSPRASSRAVAILLTGSFSLVFVHCSSGGGFVATSLASDAGSAVPLDDLVDAAGSLADDGGGGIFVIAPSVSDATLDAPADGSLPADAGGDVAADAQADSVASPCDPLGDPSQQQGLGCAIDVTRAVLVAPFGSDASGDGSQAQPFASISAALAHSSGKDRVYVCSGTYVERVAVQASVSLYGGFTCAPTWTWTGATTQVSSPSSNGALSVNQAGTSSEPIAIEDLAFSAPAALADAGMAGGSSVAAVVSNSAVRFARVSLTAGAGADAADGASGLSDPNYASGFAPQAAGQGLPFTNLCLYRDPGAPNDSSTGGAGGGADGGPSVDGGEIILGTAGTCYPPIPPGTVPGYDGTPYWSGHSPSPGADGPARPSAVAAATYGALATTTPPSWVPSAGGDGPAGRPGQGGGGTSGHFQYGLVVSMGAAGGAGGCGGSGGQGGGGGGASIALISATSQVTLASCTLKTDVAGRGGAGGSGQPGQPGAPGDNPPSTMIDVRSSAAGGSGAGGSGGAGGAAGISVAIVSDQALPTYDSATQFVMPTATPARPGSGGAGGAAATGLVDGGTAANPGPAGPPGFQGSSSILKVLPPPWDGTNAVP